MKFKNLVKIVFLSLSIIATQSCSKNEADTGANSSAERKSNNAPTKLKKISDETKAYLAGKHIAILFGYGYNEEEVKTPILADLDTHFGLDSEEKQGLIITFTYPDDFMHSGKERISRLVEHLEEENLAGLIIVGAPEGTANAIGKLQDNEESRKLPYPVFSLLPQDDVLASESVSDFVLDYAQKTNPLESTETAVTINIDMAKLLTDSIVSMINLRAPLAADENLQPFVQNLIGKDHNVSRYVDSETGLKSANHFIFE